MQKYAAIVLQILFMVETYELNHSKDRLFFDEHTVAIIQCPRKSTEGPLLWFGHPDYAVYSSNYVLNPDVPSISRISVGFNAAKNLFELHIRNFSKEDEGIYGCHGISGKRSFSVKFNAFLKVRPSNVSIMGKDKHNMIYYSQGDTVSVNCTCNEGIPAENITLMKGNQYVNHSGRGSLTFRFKAMRSDHYSVFLCKVYHSTLDEPLIDSAILYLWLQPKLYFLVIPSTKVHENESVTFHCIIESNVKSQRIILKHNDLAIANNVSILEIDMVAGRHAGQYTCFVETIAGNASAFTTLEVIHRPTFIGTPDQLIYKVYPNSDFDVDVQMSSNPTPFRVWVNASNTILQNVTLNRIGQTYHIRSAVHQLTTNDYGKYNVWIKNALGTAIILITFTQPGVKVDVIPSFVRCNSSVVLTCVLRNTNTADWSHVWIHQRNGLSIRNLTGIVSKAVSLLTISKCSYEDVGKYFCVWFDEDLSGRDDAFISVVYSPVILNRTAKYQDRKLKLSVYIHSENIAMKTKWYFNAIYIPVNSKYRLENKYYYMPIEIYQKTINERSIEAILEIINFSEADIGTYECLISTEYGSSNAHFLKAEIATLASLPEDTELSTYDNVSITNSITTDNGSSTSTMTTEQPASPSMETFKETNAYNVEFRSYLHEILTGTGCLLLIMITCFTLVMLRKKKSFTISKKSKNRNRSVLPVPVTDTSSHADNDESNYDEIDSVYYHSVDWRNYRESAIPVHSFRDPLIDPREGENILQEVKAECYMEVLDASDNNVSVVCVDRAIDDTDRNSSEHDNNFYLTPCPNQSDEEDTTVKDNDSLYSPVHFETDTYNKDASFFSISLIKTAHGIEGNASDDDQNSYLTPCYIDKGKEYMPKKIDDHISSFTELSANRNDDLRNNEIADSDVSPYQALLIIDDDDNTHLKHANSKQDDSRVTGTERHEYEDLCYKKIDHFVNCIP